MLEIVSPRVQALRTWIVDSNHSQYHEVLAFDLKATGARIEQLQWECAKHLTCSCLAEATCPAQISTCKPYFEASVIKWKRAQ